MVLLWVPAASSKDPSSKSRPLIYSPKPWPCHGLTYWPLVMNARRFGELFQIMPASFSSVELE
jgi:hypothetical protein